MTTFTNSPPPDPRGAALPLKRTPTGRPLKGIITCDDLVGTNTHFYHGRTQPCDGTDCPACLDGVPWRWHAYVSLWGPKSHSQILFEMTARSVEPLIEYREANGTLRGCMMTAQRVNLSPNARVMIQTSVADLRDFALPKSPQLLKVLSIVWNLELPSLEVDGISRSAPDLRVNSDPKLKRYAGEPGSIKQTLANGDK